MAQKKTRRHSHGRAATDAQSGLQLTAAHVKRLMRNATPSAANLTARYGTLKYITSCAHPGVETPSTKRNNKWHHPSVYRE
jgi:hypothetical protein